VKFLLCPSSALPGARAQCGLSFHLHDANLTVYSLLRIVSDGIAASITISLINYVLLGFQFKVDGFFMHSFEIFLATTVVFWGSGTLGYTLLEYRLAQKKLVSSHGRETPEALLHFSYEEALGRCCWILIITYFISCRRFPPSLKTSCGFHSCKYLSPWRIKGSLFYSI